jgi:peroxiredoxin
LLTAGCVAGTAALLAVLPVSANRASGDHVERVHFAAPEFVAGSIWINSKPLSLADLKGKVAVVHFWTHGCINCIHNYPAYQAWHTDFKDKGVVIVGIHSPEFESEKDVGRIERKAKENGLKFPIIIDNDMKHWKAWGNRYWPSIYLVDKSGQVQFRWDGEVGDAGAAALRAKIEQLLREK